LTQEASSQRGPGERYVALAEVARPHGVRGELRLKVYNPDSAILLERPAIRLVTPEGDVQAAKLQAIRPVPGALLARLDGVRDRDAAEALRGAQLEVARDRFPPAEDDEFYCCDLEGCEVTCDGKPVGRVAHVASYPTCDALVVAREGQPRLEVPMVERYVGAIDLDAGTIELHTLDGLEG